MSIELAYQQLAIQLQSLYEKREANTIANWVIEHITGLKRIDRIIEKNKALTNLQESSLNKMTAELLAHKPIQYVLEEAWFAGWMFYVNESVLIPRPETEELVAWIVEENSNMLGIRILDIGTGSGCIPIALKKQIAGSSLMSIDISENAINVATKNANQLQANIELACLDFLDKNNWNQLPEIDIIVSNPPYIKQNERSSMAAHVVDFEPSIALFVPDNDALLFYRNIAEFASTHLSENGCIYLEINEALGNEVVELLQEKGFFTELKKDLQGKNRMVKAQLIN